MPMFELDRLISYDDDALLAELRRVAALVDSPFLSASAFDKHSKAHSSGIRRRFGGWQQALERAGLADRYSGAPRGRRIVGRTFTDEQLLDELRTVSAKINGQPVTVEAFNQHADMNAETVRRRFGSWWAALKQAGLEISNLGKRYSDDDYFENLAYCLDASRTATHIRRDGSTTLDYPIWRVRSQMEHMDESVTCVS